MKGLRSTAEFGRLGYVSRRYVAARCQCLATYGSPPVGRVPSNAPSGQISIWRKHIVKVFSCVTRSDIHQGLKSLGLKSPFAYTLGAVIVTDS